MEKYTLVVMLPDGNKYLVDNDTEETIAVFPPDEGRFCCKEWEKYLKEHKEVRESYRLKYDCVMMFTQS